MQKGIQRDRLIRDFLALTAIDSESFHEQEFAYELRKMLEELGVSVWSDKTGNLYGSLKGKLDAPTLLFSAHMDTVKPGIGKKVIVHEDGKITSDGSTVLGADDVAGIVEILEAIRVLKEEASGHRDIELLFPVAEEVYIQGSRLADFSCLQAKEAYVLDLSAPIGTASVQEPTLISFCIRINGRAAHAGFMPEEGINAIAAAAEAVSQIKQGRIENDTTVNIGEICGGTGTNIVPDTCVIKGEIRSFQHEKALAKLEQITDIFEKAAANYTASAAIQHTIHLNAYKVDGDNTVVTRFEAVCRKLGITPVLTKTFGGSDNNSFFQNGIRGIVLACGMNRVHTTEEYTTIDELTKSTAIVLELMKTDQ